MLTMATVARQQEPPHATYPLSSSTGARLAINNLCRHESGTLFSLARDKNVVRFCGNRSRIAARRPWVAMAMMMMMMFPEFPAKLCNKNERVQKKHRHPIELARFTWLDHCAHSMCLSNVFYRICFGDTSWRRSKRGRDVGSSGMDRRRFCNA